MGHSRQRPPLVLLHGFTGSSASWGTALLAALAAEGRRVIPLDLPGHGARGDQDRADLDQVVALVEASVHGPFDLMGYSMGGRLALHCAFRLPGRVRRLVLESASPGLASEDERTARRDADEELARRIEAEGVQAFAEAWAELEVLRPGPGRAPLDHRRAETIRRSHTARGLAAALRGLGTGSLPSLWDRLPALEVPTRLLAGALDGKFVAVARRISEALPDASVEIVPEAGHTVHLDRPDAWLTAVESWLDGSV